jgi:adenylate kinase family enzyme
MFSFIFLLGRPGCGKSIIYNMLGERLRKEKLAREVMRIDDFPVLKDIVDEDKEFKRHLRKEGGFEVTDLSMLDDVLKRINDQLKKLEKQGRVIFVEFSRNSYAHAMKNFDRKVLDRSLILYIYTPFDVCLQRNVRRFKEGPKNLDDHIVPSDMMHKYYRNDDYEALFLRSEDELQKQAPTKIITIKNNMRSLEKLELEIDQAFTELRRLV